MDPYAEGPIYTSEQIKVPPELPQVIKEYTKAAIRSQPADLIQWSSAYFTALNSSKVPPVKERFEDVSQAEDSAVTKGKLQVLNKQLLEQETVDRSDLLQYWKAVGCSEDPFVDLLSLGGFEDQVPWKKFLVLACSSIAPDLPNALKLLCEILTTEPDGSACRINYDEFESLYTFLAEVDGNVEMSQVKSVLDYLKSDPVPRFGGQVGPGDFLHQNCPSLTSS